MLEIIILLLRKPKIIKYARINHYINFAIEQSAISSIDQIRTIVTLKMPEGPMALLLYWRK